ncbi:hypothetical protein G6F35_017617 [Rhizopus arrhizus]|nr:hypothetical protein G6F35_017617 [Rhizopus arrhizus]
MSWHHVVRSPASGSGFTDRRGQAVQRFLHQCCVIGFHRDPYHRLGTGRAQERTATTSHRLLRDGQRGLHAVGLHRGLGRDIAQPHVDRLLRYPHQPLQRLAQGLPAAAQRHQYLQGADDAIASGCPVQAQQVAGGFTTQHATAFDQRLAFSTP